MKWTRDRIPDQSGRLAVVTGANSGIGYETARALALRGAHVILACRNAARGEAAATRIREGAGQDTAVAETLDLANRDSIRGFADRIRDRELSIDLLINNAGVMIPPLESTVDGFELQIGTNHLGHFLLTGLLLDSIRNAPEARVVTVSSIAHRHGQIDFESFRFDSFGASRPYNPFREYRQSKLANLMFAIELDRRLVASTYGFRSVAAHPGVARTDLVRHRKIFDAAALLIGMSSEQGALPTLYAATDSEARGGGYYGPDGFQEMWGYPTEARIMPQATDPEVTAKLWQVSEEVTGHSIGI